MLSVRALLPLVTVLAVGACTTAPSTPFVVLPGTARDAAAFQQDNSICRQHATTHTGYGVTSHDAAPGGAIGSATRGDEAARSLSLNNKNTSVGTPSDASLPESSAICSAWRRAAMSSVRHRRNTTFIREPGYPYGFGYPDAYLYGFGAYPAYIGGFHGGWGWHGRHSGGWHGGRSGAADTVVGTAADTIDPARAAGQALAASLWAASLGAARRDADRNPNGCETMTPGPG